VHVRSREFTPEEIACGIKPLPADFDRGVLHSEYGKELIGSCLYWRQINLFRRFFPDDRIHVAFFDDFTRNQQETAGKCFRFLGLDPLIMTVGSSIKLNTSETRRERRFAYDAIMRFPVIKRLAPLLPKQLRLKKARKPIWTRKSYDHVISTIREDTRQFLEHYGRASSFWDLSEARFH
jgi:hypothetical protein